MADNKNTITFSDNELAVLRMLVGIGATAFDVPGGPAYVIKGRLEEKLRKLVTTDDIINIIKKIEDRK